EDPPGHPIRGGVRRVKTRERAHERTSFGLGPTASGGGWIDEISGMGSPPGLERNGFVPPALRDQGDERQDGVREGLEHAARLEALRAEVERVPTDSQDEVIGRLRAVREPEVQTVRGPAKARLQLAARREERLRPFRPDLIANDLVDHSGGPPAR